jgi:peptidoglycan/LPS O-acetylase OafA/YrhL
MADEGKGRENNLNLLRLVLAASVILAHSPELIDGNRGRELAARIFGSWVSLGVLAVDGFFILSGYLIAQSWERNPRVYAYLRKRVVRIYPGFLVACVISALLASLGGNDQYWGEFRVLRFVKGLLVLAVPKIPAAFLALPHSIINGPLWTISYEFACYLGLAILGVMGLLRRRWLVLVGTILVTVWATAQAKHWLPPISHRIPIGASNSDLPRLMSCFLTGTCYYLFRDKVRFTGPATLAAMGLLLSAMFRESTATVAIPLCGGYLLLAAGLGSPVPGTAWVRKEDVSYGVYLYAWPIQQLLINHWRYIDPWLLSAITLPLAFLAGWASWNWIERPAMKRWR